MIRSDEHAGLQRVAALLGSDASEAVFAAATEELAHVVDPETGEVGVEMAVIARYEADHTFTILEYWGEPGDALARSSRWRLEGASVVVQVYETGAVARLDGYEGEPGAIAATARVTGTISSVAAPITVDGALWGSISVHGRRRLPEGIEDRIAHFAPLVGAAVANADLRVSARRLAEEQAALRRVATLVGRAVPQEELFAAVAEEVGRMLEADAAGLIRYEPADVGTVLAWWSPPGRERAPVGHSWPAGGGLATRIAATRRTVRIDDWGPLPGPIAEFVRDQLGIRSSLGAPVIVNERVWGSLMAHSLRDPLPAGAELRLMSFAELVATTITNEESRAEVRRLADRHAALREVATLVAGQPSPQEVFSAVVEHVGRVLGFDVTRLLRYRSDGTAQHLICWPADEVPVGAVLPLDGDSVAGRVLATGRPARIDDYTDVPGALAEATRSGGGRAAAGAPIVVDARLWGVLVGVSNRPDPLPAGIESRVEEFTALVATAISNVEARAEVRRLADEQAALRRVATLVARQPSAEEVFPIVVEELGRVLGFDSTRLLRYRDDGTVEHVLSWPPGDTAPATRFPLDGDSVTARIKRTWRPARIDDFTGLQGSFADRGITAVAGAPIIVGGQLWGALIGTSKSLEPLALGVESRIEEFAALIANAISNVQARSEVNRLADEQAALRRVATLVARQPSAEEVFDTVVQEVGRLLPVDATRLIRFESDGSGTMVSGWPRGGDFPVGTNRPLDGDNLSSRIRKTWAPARMDDYAGATGPFAADVQTIGRAVAGAPIIVEGRMWGILLATCREPLSLPPDIESRIEEFTALIATAISNVEARAALAASRERIVVATDETRRRFERDLHDGAQQRLVSLALELRLAQQEAAPGLRERIAHGVDGINEVLDDLRELSSGLHPAILSEGGLRPALRALARRSAVPVRLRDEPDERFEERVEVAAYYVVSEALANAAKHAAASVVEVSIARHDGWLTISIRDDGSGGADPAKGSGLVGLSDRVEALGGTIAIASAAGAGTAIEVELPLVPSSPR